MGWESEAKCRGMDTNIFFPERGHSTVTIRAVREVCAKCPVKQQCLEIGLSEEIQVGFYGGMSANQRRTMLEQARRRKVA